jgi:hypothetical protein
VIAIQTGRTATAEFKRMKGLSILLDQIVGQPQVQTAIVTFDSQVDLLQDFSFAADSILNHLKKLPSGDGGAAILDAAHYSVKLLDKQPQDSRRVLLLISETRDHGSHAVKIDDVVAAIADSNTVVYTLAFSPTVSNVLDNLRGYKNDDVKGNGIDVITLLVLARNALKQNAAKAIASMTGGEYELFKSRKSFENFMMEFANHLHSRYLLRFGPKNPRPGLHDVRVKLLQPGGYVILARRSYWVGGSEDTPQ